MTTIKNITIPQACHQSWQQMNEVKEGRHCEHCCKTVVDFTIMTNNEIINHLSTKNNVCGRFDQAQLNNVNHWLYVKNLSATNWWKRIVVVMGLFGSLPLFKANGETKPVIVSTTDTTKSNNKPKVDKFMLGKVVMPESLKYRTIKGRVTGSDDGLPIAGAVIKLKGTNIGTQTDVLGDFMINVPNSTDALTVSYVGYVLQQIRLTNTQLQQYRIVMKVAPTTMGEVVITSY
ncbi:carboxypeptidase-like regulatory domain-containing protein [Mucilaginibacter sp. McL0603]|uniref:carboxypeptidase-like regulatory domain-containing protein n=1 Tax=Mucilaginibacter sp. McL0603 TaxID=3415670 RepID=UPI003CF2937B